MNETTVRGKFFKQEMKRVLKNAVTVKQLCKCGYMDSIRKYSGKYVKIPCTLWMK